MNRFFRSLESAFDAIIGPRDVSGSSRLWAIRALAVGGAVYLFYCTPSGAWREPIIGIVVIGFSIVLTLVVELRKLLIRVERLESDAKARQASDAAPAEPLFSN
jgi:hypothetical protein